MMGLIPVLLVPFNGIVVRYRACYAPNALEVSNDPEAVVETDIAPQSAVKPSYFRIRRQVLDAEGWQGLLKGLMPTLLANASPLAFFSLFKIYMSPSPNDIYSHRPSTLWVVLTNLVYIVYMIITYRAITTTDKLGYFKPTQAIRSLLTPYERKKPWTLLQTPGLLSTFLVRFIFQKYLLFPLRAFLDNSTRNYRTVYDLDAEFYARVTCIILVVFLTSAIFAPVDVIVTRLAIQRNYGKIALEQDTPALVEESVSEKQPEVLSEKQNEVPESADKAEQDKSTVVPDAQEQPDNTVAATGEVELETTTDASPIVSVRFREEPYAGFIDCARKIIKEEGWRTLYRMWWLTFVGCLM